MSRPLRDRFEALGVLLDEVVIDQALGDDHVGHRVEQPDVGARPQLQVRSAMSAIQIARGSATTSVAPPLHGPLHLHRDDRMGLGGVAMPMTNRKSASRISPIEFVIAPAPNVVTRPATVGACHVAAHWWTLLVPKAARASFCIR